MWHDAFLTRVRGDARVNKPTATSVVQKHSADDCAPCTSLAHDDKDAAAGSRVRRAALSWLSPRARLPGAQPAAPRQQGAGRWRQPFLRLVATASRRCVVSSRAGFNLVRLCTVAPEAFTSSPRSVAGPPRARSGPAGFTNVRVLHG